MQSTTFNLSFEKGYIAHPYWPARDKVINIVKESGTSRARSEAKRTQSLNDYLTAKDMTMEAYQALVATANRQFYTAGDLDEPGDHPSDEIVIPGHQWYGCLAQGADTVTKSLRVASAANIRTVLHVGDLFTGKTAHDGIWERFVVVKLGMGAKLSNQRSLRTNQFIENFSAPLEVSYPDDVDPIKVRNFITWCGREIGIGASRKLGWGRFATT